MDMAQIPYPRQIFFTTRPHASTQHSAVSNKITCRGRLASWRSSTMPCTTADVHCLCTTASVTCPSANKWHLPLTAVGTQQYHRHLFCRLASTPASSSPPSSPPSSSSPDSSSSPSSPKSSPSPSSPSSPSSPVSSPRRSLAPSSPSS